MNQKKVKLLRRLFGGHDHIIGVSQPQIITNGKKKVVIRGVDHFIPTFQRVTGELKRRFRNEKKIYTKLPAHAKETYSKSLKIYLKLHPHASKHTV